MAWHPFPGASGSVTAVAVGGMLWVYRRGVKEYPQYKLSATGDPRDYEPIMNKYIRLAEFLIGISTGSVVLIIGSSALHGQGIRLPWFYASPLILMASSVIYGMTFMACQILTWEEVINGNPHSASLYALNETFGFSGLLTFLIGYVWLIIAATNL